MVVRVEVRHRLLSKGLTTRAAAKLLDQFSVRAAVGGPDTYVGARSVPSDLR